MVKLIIFNMISTMENSQPGNIKRLMIETTVKNPYSSKSMKCAGESVSIISSHNLASFE